MFIVKWLWLWPGYNGSPTRLHLHLHLHLRLHLLRRQRGGRRQAFFTLVSGSSPVGHFCGPPPSNLPLLKRPSTMPTFQSLPLEIITSILHDFIGESHTLLQCSLVHRFWTAPALDLLYRVVLIHDRTLLATLAHESVRHRLEKIVYLDLFAVKWSLEIEVVLRACVRLKVLRLYAIRVPSDLLEYPSLQGLYFPILLIQGEHADPRATLLGVRTLSLLRTAFNYLPEDPPTSTTPTVPAHLQSLEIDYSTASSACVHNLIKASLEEPTPSLKSLTIDNGHDSLPSLLPIASNLTSIDLGYFTISLSHFVLDFLSHAVNLSHLAMRVAHTEMLTAILNCLKVSLKSLTVALDAREGKAAVKMLREVMETTLRDLVEIKFIWVGNGLAKLERLKGWKQLVAVLERKGTKVIKDHGMGNS